MIDTWKYHQELIRKLNSPLVIFSAKFRYIAVRKDGPDLKLEGMCSLLFCNNIGTINFTGSFWLLFFSWGGSGLYLFSALFWCGHTKCDLTFVEVSTSSDWWLL